MQSSHITQTGMDAQELTMLELNGSGVVCVVIAPTHNMGFCLCDTFCMPAGHGYVEVRIPGRAGGASIKAAAPMGRAGTGGHMSDGSEGAQSAGMGSQVTMPCCDRHCRRHGIKRTRFWLG